MRIGSGRNEIAVDWVPVPCECGWLYNGRTGLTVGKTINNFIQLAQFSTFLPGCFQELVVGG